MRTKPVLLALLVVGLCATSALAGPRAQRAGTEVGPAHTVTAYDPAKGCSGDGPVVAQGWCSYYDGATSGQAGQPVELAATVCRLPGQDTHTLQLDNGEQASFDAATLDDTDAIWTWSKGHRFTPYGTTFQVAPGRCLRWHVTWKVVDDVGRPLAPGVYALMARANGYDAGRVRIQAYVNEVHFVVS